MLPYWEYFLALEEDLIKTTRYVEFAVENMETFSVEFARLLLSAGSECDVIAKELCKATSLPLAAENINEYRQAITTKFPKFFIMEVKIMRYCFLEKPWADWGHGKNPDWWTSYNKVKHERNEHFKKATLRNVFGAMCGLFCLLLYYYKCELRDFAFLDPVPQLFSPARYDVDYSMTIRWKYLVPDEG